MLDPVSLVHGVFFARKEWPWQPKIARAVTSFIEAYQVIPAVSGGVKRDSVVNDGKEGATSEGYGMVPYHRVEYTAGTITAYFTVDHQQFRSYGLSQPATAPAGSTGGLRDRIAARRRTAVAHRMRLRREVGARRPA